MPVFFYFISETKVRARAEIYSGKVLLFVCRVGSCNRGFVAIVARGYADGVHATLAIYSPVIIFIHDLRVCM